MIAFVLCIIGLPESKFNSNIAIVNNGDIPPVYRNKMLREDNLIVRLRSQLHYLRLLNNFQYCCIECGPSFPVVDCSDLMSISTDGPFYHLKPEQGL